jgi:hypothetical protein
MNNLAKCLLLVIVFFGVTAKLAFADDAGADAATCAVSITVDSIVEWEGDNFAALAPANITAQADAPTDSETYTLWTNSNVVLTAKNTGGAGGAQLRHTDGTVDTLVTKYMIAFDGDGVDDTGGTDSADWVDYTTFLNPGVAITHVNTDGAVEITLSVQATNNPDNVEDTGLYEAVQELTATWASDN